MYFQQFLFFFFECKIVGPPNSEYPNGILRNLASLNSRTELVFGIDVDFYLSRSLETSLYSYIGTLIQPELPSHPKVALVVIAFELDHLVFGIPHTKVGIFLRNGHFALFFLSWLLPDGLSIFIANVKQKNRKN